MQNASRVLLIFFLILLALTGAASPGQVSNAAPDADPTGAHWAERTLHQMTLQEKVGQLFMIKAETEPMNPAGPAYSRLREALQKYHLGGFLVTVPVEIGLLVKASPLDAAALTNQLQRDSPLPLIFAADFERGLPMRFTGGTGFPHAMAFGAAGRTDYAYQFGRITAAEARAVGVHWNFYPDADVNSNPANPIINTRSFGEDPTEVAALVQAFVRGTRDGGGMSTAKHFPGHGDTDTDSHLALSRISGTRTRLDQVELPPFRAAIAAGTDAVMVGHLLVPALDPDPRHVATISSNIATGLLRGELGFQGIVVTDAMDMNGVTRIFGGNTAESAGRAAVAAIQAGADLIIVPGDLAGAYNGVLAAVSSGELSESRIDQSASRLLRAKASLGLQRNRFVDLDAVSAVLARPENLALAQQVADDALALVREGGPRPTAHGPPRKLLPLPESAHGSSRYTYHPAAAASDRLLVLVFTDDHRGENGRVLVREIRARMPDARVLYVDTAQASTLAPQVLQAASRAERIVAAIYAIPTPGRVAGDIGSPGLREGPSAVLGSVLRSGAAKTAVVAFGNPYLIEQFPTVLNYLCTFSNAPVSEVSAVKFLFGEIPARGHLPVTIPGVADRVPWQVTPQP